MQPSSRKRYLLLILFGVLIAYLLVNTGVFSDEFETKFTSNKQYYLDVPVLYLTHFIWYPLFDNGNQAVVNVLKILYIFLSFCMISRFFKIFLSEEQAMLASFLFIFFPSHDATTYWFMGQYLTLSFAFYLFAFYLAYKNRLIPAFISGLIASFICYGSTPLALGLFALFLLNKEVKKAIVIIAPNIIYAAYFIPLNVFMRMGSPRIIEAFDFGAVLKQFALQVLTFFDATLGPSLWLKVYYALPQLSAVSIVVSAAIVIVLWSAANALRQQRSVQRFDVKFVIGSIVMLFFTFAMFAVTGRYPQIAFNLGDRVTIYGSLLVTYLIMSLPMPKAVRTLVIAALLISIIGISGHWKAWSSHQNTVIARIEKNEDLKNYKDTRTIYVSGNQYSAYGPLSHIEFFSEGSTVAFAFKNALGDWRPADTINKHFVYDDGFLVDTKYGQKMKVDDYINVYDSEKDRLYRVNASDINKYIASLPADNRHWVQLIKAGFMKDIAVRLMPRLKYAI